MYPPKKPAIKEWNFSYLFSINLQHNKIDLYIATNAASLEACVKLKFKILESS